MPGVIETKKKVEMNRVRADSDKVGSLKKFLFGQRFLDDVIGL